MTEAAPHFGESDLDRDRIGELGFINQHRVANGVHDRRGIGIIEDSVVPHRVDNQAHQGSVDRDGNGRWS